MCVVCVFVWFKHTLWSTTARKYNAGPEAQVPIVEHVPGSIYSQNVLGWVGIGVGVGEREYEE